MTRRVLSAFIIANLLTVTSLPVQAQEEAYGPPADGGVVVAEPAPPAIPVPLHRAASIAAATHPRVGAAEAEGRALEAEYKSAKWMRAPSLTVEALAATRGSSIADRDGRTVNVALEQPIWAGGRISSEINRARASLAAGEDRIDEAAHGIVVEVVAAYYDYVLAAERKSALDESLEQHRSLLASIERRVEREVSPLVDLTLGRSRTAQVELSLASAEELQDSAAVRLLELTGGVPVAPVLPPAGVAQMVPPEDQALEEALQCSPTLAALADLVTVAEAQKGIARGNILPQLLLQLSRNEITGSRAALVLRAQTGNGLSQFRLIDSADARIARTIAEFGEAERRLRERLRRNYIQVRASERRIEAGIIAADTSAQLIESYQRQFIAGRRSWLDVMNAVREAAAAQLSESEARVSAASGVARIMALSCRWTPAPVGFER